jgi:hypothetical protein
MRFLNTDSTPESPAGYRAPTVAAVGCARFLRPPRNTHERDAGLPVLALWGEFSADRDLAADHRNVASSSQKNNSEPEDFTSRPQPQWLGSLARRGDPKTFGNGWNDHEGEEAVKPRWLGSLARRDGAKTAGDGWADPDDPAGPHWLGSLKRRGESGGAPDMRNASNAETSDASEPATRPMHLVDISDPSVEESEQAEQASENSPNWQGSSLRASLNAVPEPKEALPPPEGPYTTGELGMHLRVA